jgi:hypothetical protein
MRFRPANISVINRRARFSAVLRTVVGKSSRLTSGNGSRLCRPSTLCQMLEWRSPARVRFAASNYAAPLPAARRSGQKPIRWAAPAGTLHDLSWESKKRKAKKGLTGRSISILRRLLDVIDHRYIHRRFPRFELEPKLPLQSAEYRCSHCGAGLDRAFRGQRKESLP